MNIDNMISHCGLITGGFMAHRHLLVLWQVTAKVAVSEALTDNAVFYLKRKFHNHPRILKLMARKSFTRALAIIGKGPWRFVCVFRFIFGMRLAGPLALVQPWIKTT